MKKHIILGSTRRANSIIQEHLTFLYSELYKKGFPQILPLFFMVIFFLHLPLQKKKIAKNRLGSVLGGLG